MNAPTRIDGFLADGAERPGRDRDIVVLLIHETYPRSSRAHRGLGAPATTPRPSWRSLEPTFESRRHPELNAWRGRALPHAATGARSTGSGPTEERSLSWPGNHGGE